MVLCIVSSYTYGVLCKYALPMWILKELVKTIDVWGFLTPVVMVTSLALAVLLVA